MIKTEAKSRFFLRSRLRLSFATTLKRIPRSQVSSFPAIRGRQEQSFLDETLQEVRRSRWEVNRSPARKIVRYRPKVPEGSRCRHTGSQTYRHMGTQTYRYKRRYLSLVIYTRYAHRRNEFILAEVASTESHSLSLLHVDERQEGQTNR